MPTFDIFLKTLTFGHFSIFGLVFFVLKSLLGIARQWSREKFAIVSLKPRSHVRILLHHSPVPLTHSLLEILPKNAF